eukprot:scaffold59057_cov66-Phaeocystis_antarctica.AAC.1
MPRRRNSQALMPASAAARCDRRHASGHGRRRGEDDGSPRVPRPPPPWAAGAALQCRGAGGEASGGGAGRRGSVSLGGLIARDVDRLAGSEPGSDTEPSVSVHVGTVSRDLEVVTVPREATVAQHE